MRPYHPQNGDIGTIIAGPLKGAHATYIRRTGAGSTVAELNEAHGAYQAGDIVHLSTGEWQPRPRCPDCGAPGENKGHQACQYPQEDRR